MKWNKVAVLCSFFDGAGSSLVVLSNKTCPFLLKEYKMEKIRQRSQNKIEMVINNCKMGLVDVMLMYKTCHVTQIIGLLVPNYYCPPNCRVICIDNIEICE